MKIDGPPRRIALVTDFGDGPYTGQMQLSSRPLQRVRSLCRWCLT